jgi:hypothetical protein
MMRKDNIDNIEEWKPMAAIEKYLSVSREISCSISTRGLCRHANWGGNGTARFLRRTEWLRSGNASESEKNGEVWDTLLKQ